MGPLVGLYGSPTLWVSFGSAVLNTRQARLDGGLAILQAHGQSTQEEGDGEVLLANLGHDRNRKVCLAALAARLFWFCLCLFCLFCVSKEKITQQKRQV